ncbi:MAG: hypothetical protein WEB60_02710, partial [Terrimicrobiaceae bacterium]
AQSRGNERGKALASSPGATFLNATGNFSADRMVAFGVMWRFAMMRFVCALLAMPKRMARSRMTRILGSLF